MSNSTTTDGYTGAEGILNLAFALYNNPDKGTGIMNLVNFAKNLLGPEVPPAIVAHGLGLQLNLFGSYPEPKDKAPSIVFAVLFGIVLVIHTVIFLINCSRGHYFWISIAWIFYSVCKVIGFSLRAYWAPDATRIQAGLTSEVFLIVPAVIILSANLILAQRLFTWRHPVGGSRKLFWAVMMLLYGFVLVLVGITIAASFVPYLNFITTEAYVKWQHVVQFSSVCLIAYSFCSISLIALSFWFPTSKDENLYTYQPWWIESFAPFYFVKKNAAQYAEASFMRRNHNHRHAIRVIAASSHHYKMVKGLTNKRGDLKHNWSIVIVITTTLLILIGVIGRCIVVFQPTNFAHSTKAADPWLMYVCWGILELLVNVIYILGRVDLRFYRPDILPATVRAIVTAEQTYYPSSDEEDDGFHRDRPETYGRLQEKRQQHVGGIMSDSVSPVTANGEIRPKSAEDDVSQKISSASSHGLDQITEPPYPVISTGDDFKF
ncbi:uncharacterized protein SPAPADRAFT_65959 [Spathaspora passalidarum NRRL Y-27907]|uniref:Uncharacterized protein n=1 Tax=Spathaspora passalidarum (strain NRRL Y-27907 / 11-Y1) TaxID=619300 RepID=G3AKN9_SPAPN|nr:uncharacterized protein SPAPADRAFT_65959 [Spathaspora passalidarum NRRL Y-27907]EGW32943.1 hypothetical protein SPAPADRAFT_65959 [Spathaspora passalidarum NRRL Y-27907]